MESKLNWILERLVEFSNCHEAEQFPKYPKEVDNNMPNSGNFHMSKSNAPKIFCAWCQKWKTGHIVLKFTKGANWKIHKHSKGDKACKGSDKVVMKPNSPVSSEK